MSNYLVFEDGILIENSISDNLLWAGLCSVATCNGKIIEYVQSCLPKNTLCVIPRSDGNINRIKDNNFHDVDWDKRIQPYLDYAKKKGKVFILGTLCQIDEEKDINYLYLPLDDNFFNYGINNYFNPDNFPSWDKRSTKLCWRGSCSGVRGSQSLRARFVEAIHKYDINENVKLSNWWIEKWHDGNTIPEYYFADRLHYTEFFNYKIFFIVDGACIASNHMYGFATGAIPFLLSNANCWFSHLILPYVHYIPVNYDLSNLIEQIEWVKNNDDKAKIIANNASHFSKIYFSSEYQKKYIKENIENIVLKCDDNFIKNKNSIRNKLKIKYGLIYKNIDVTDICLLKLINNNIITIPAGDNNRAKYFGDPIPYILKKIFIIIDDNQIEYEDFYTIKINILNNEINTHKINTHDIDNKTATLHSSLKIMYGSFNDELPEQKMVVRYLTGNEKVLEIGGNIGRNSLIIASILVNNEYFVTLESDKNIANQLIENRDLNNFNFKIENSALSKRKLIQKGWETEVSDELKEGYTWVNTIKLDELKEKYNIEFDTLILDCEGAFYYILMDMPEILNNINLVIMENDYWDISKKQYIDNILFKNNFYIDYVESGGWGPCYNNFYEVWKKNT
jgi:FkbM family methyltransferase